MREPETHAPEPPRLPFRHENRGRSAANLLVLLAALAVLGLGFATGRGELVLLVMAACLGGILYFKLFDPRAGIEIGGGAITFWHGGERATVPLAEIDHVTIRRGGAQASDPPGAKAGHSVDVTIHRRDGSGLDVPARCLPLPEALSAALKQAGARVERG